MIRVTTKDKGCYVRDKSSFHVNMNGLSLNTNEKEKLFVKVDQFVMPAKVKKLNFIMSFGYDTKFLKNEDTQKYEIDYMSMHDLCHQVNMLVYNNFILKSNCIEDGNDVPLSASSSKNDDATEENLTEISTENSAENLNVDSVENSDRNPTGDGSENPTENADVVESAVVINGPPPVIKKGSGQKVDVSSLIVNHSLREKMRASKTKVSVDEMFCVKYVDGRIHMRMAVGYMFFASVNLMLALGFRSQVMRLSGSNGKTEEDILHESDNLTMKICRPFTTSDIVHFLADKDRICHVAFKKLIEPSFHVDGNLHSVLFSFDVEKKAILCNMKRLNNMSLREVQFHLYNNMFEPYELGACVKKCPISFNLVICKKL